MTENNEINSNIENQSNYRKTLIKGYDNYYIDTNGVVYKNDKVVSAYHRSGSLCVKLACVEKRVKMLMLETFLPNLADRKISYKNGDFTDCSLGNLIVLDDSIKSTVKRLSKEDVLEIYEKANSGKYKIGIIAQDYGINIRYVHKIKNKEVRKECFGEMEHEKSDKEVKYASGGFISSDLASSIFKPIGFL